jgi:hypothetical protein
MAEETLGDLVKDAKKGKGIVLPSGHAEAYMDIPDSILRARQDVINEIYDFAQQFEGHEENDLEEEVEYIDPLSLPVSEYLDFFAAMEKVWDKSESETDELSKIHWIKRRRLLNVQSSIGEDAERVAEALLYAIADKVADDDPKLARLIGKLEGDLEGERRAEDSEDDAVTGYARNVSSPGSAQTNAIYNMVEAEESEEEAESIRVKDTKKIFDHIKPILEDLHLKESLEEWISFSN